MTSRATAAANHEPESERTRQQENPGGASYCKSDALDPLPTRPLRERLHRKSRGQGGVCPPDVKHPTRLRTIHHVSDDGFAVRVTTTVEPSQATSTTGWHEPAPLLRRARSASTGSVVSSRPTTPAALRSPARRRGLSATRTALMRAEGGGYTTDHYERRHEVKRGYFYPYCLRRPCCNRARHRSRAAGGPVVTSDPGCRLHGSRLECLPPTAPCAGPPDGIGNRVRVAGPSTLAGPLPHRTQHRVAGRVLWNRWALGHGRYHRRRRPNCLLELDVPIDDRGRRRGSCCHRRPFGTSCSCGAGRCLPRYRSTEHAGRREPTLDGASQCHELWRLLSGRTLCGEQTARRL